MGKGLAIWLKRWLIRKQGTRIELLRLKLLRKRVLIVTWNVWSRGILVLIWVEGRNGGILRIVIELGRSNSRVRLRLSKNRGSILSRGDDWCSDRQPGEITGGISGAEDEDDEDPSSIAIVGKKKMSYSGSDTIKSLKIERE